MHQGNIPATLSSPHCTDDAGSDRAPADKLASAMLVAVSGIPSTFNWFVHENARRFSADALHDMIQEAAPFTSCQVDKVGS